LSKLYSVAPLAEAVSVTDSPLQTEVVLADSPLTVGRALTVPEV
jgi:hypothetical protein